MDMKPVPAQMIFQMEYEEGFHDGYRQAMREMPEIIRCKDCKYRRKIPILGNIVCVDNSVHSPDWFCADGKRKYESDE